LYLFFLRIFFSLTPHNQPIKQTDADDYVVPVITKHNDADILKKQKEADEALAAAQLLQKQAETAQKQLQKEKSKKSNEGIEIILLKKKILLKNVEKKKN